MEKSLITFCNLVQEISPNISRYFQFNRSTLSRKTIFFFSRLQFGHFLISSHYFKSSLNDSLLCTFHKSPANYNFSNIHIDCSSLISQRTSLSSLLRFFDVSFDSQHILISHWHTVILSSLSFFLLFRFRFLSTYKYI